MNISDQLILSKAEEIKNQYSNVDRLEVIFALQDTLRGRYGVPILNLDVPADQSLAREMAWNTVEEMAEALAVKTSNTKHREHILDETADCLSFYIELLIICGMSAADFIPPKDTVEDDLGGWFEVDTPSFETDLRRSHSIFVEKIAIAINNLKNRKWRKTNVHTNDFLLKKDLYITFLNFIRFVKQLEIDSDDLYDAYVRKYCVNEFRLDSNY